VVDATETDELPDGSVFPDVAAASAYHECGAVGYCPTPDGDRLAGVELATGEWRVEPLSVDSVRASFFEQFPDDAVSFDNALLMRDIGHEWRPRRALATDAAGAAP
jgi:putative hemolysin